MQSLVKFSWLVRRWAALFVASAALFGATGARSQQERIYIAPDDHTDYVWTADEETYQKAILQMTDYYLDLADKTATNPKDYQSRWNFDGSLWMWIWENNRDQKQVDRLIARLRDGHFSMPLTFAVSTYGGMPTEAVLRGMYYAGSVERRYGLNFPMAIAMENQTLPNGLGALWAGSGAKYSWRGVCGCATKLEPTIFHKRPHEIYWWKGPDGSRILMKWYSLHNQFCRECAYLPGSYLEARDPLAEKGISFLNNLAFQSNYPYRIFGFFGEGGDNLSTMNDSFVKAARRLSGPDREVIVSNEEDFFRDFEAHYGTQLPTFSGSFGNEWDMYSASMQEVASSVRRTTEKLRSAEALETLVSLKQPGFPKQFTESSDRAWTSYGLFWEHDWTADSHSLPRLARAEWQRRIAHNITSYVDNLSTASVQALGTLIIRHGVHPRYFIFNPLNWERTDVADLPYEGSEDVHVVDLTTGSSVPSQLSEVAADNGSPRPVLRILAMDIPSVGYKVFGVEPGKSADFPNMLKAGGNSIENEYYRLEMNGRGAIQSLIDKRRGEREIAAHIDGRYLNDLGPGVGTVTIKNVGPVSITLQAKSSQPVPHTTEVTLISHSDRIEIRNEITANFSNVNTWAFSFNLQTPDVWHEELGAINHARLQPEGDYAAKFSRLDWLTLNHFVAMSGSDGVGITLSNSDDAFMKLGHSKIADGKSELDTSTPQISVLAGGQVDGPSLGIPAQGGDSHFLQRFALRVQNKFNAASSMRFALEDQNPLIVGLVTGGNAYPETTFSLLTTSNPNVLLWVLKPSEDGIDNWLVTRFWNMSPQPGNYSVSVIGGLQKASVITHIETAFTPKQLTSGELRIDAKPWQLQTFGLLPSLKSAIITPNVIGN
jgi:alpha-mannosidase